MIGKEIVTTAAGKAAPVHVNHDWASVGAIDLARFFPSVLK
jgi:hypothetical protein